MQGQFRVSREGAKEFLDQLGVHRADSLAGELHIPGEVGAAGNIHGGFGERFVHRDQRLAKATDAAFVAERLGDGLAEDDADILDRVVAVDMQIAARLDGEIEQAMAGEGGEHVVEEAHAGFDGRLAAAIKREGEADVGLGGAAGECHGAAGLPDLGLIHLGGGI